MSDRIPGSSPSNPIVYRDFEIWADYPGTYSYAHKDYDPTPMYLDDGPSDNRGGWARTVEECKAEIDEWHEDNDYVEPNPHKYRNVAWVLIVAFIVIFWAGVAHFAGVF